MKNSVKTFKRIMAMLVCAAMIVAAVPFVPAVLGNAGSEANAVYAAGIYTDAEEQELSKPLTIPSNWTIQKFSVKDLRDVHLLINADSIKLVVPQEDKLSDVRVLDGAYNDVSDDFDPQTLTFSYDSRTVKSETAHGDVYGDVYTFDFVYDSVAYTLKANCKTVNCGIPCDTTDLENAVTTAHELIAIMIDHGYSDQAVIETKALDIGNTTTTKLIADEAVFADMMSAHSVAAELAAKEFGRTQSKVDDAVNALNLAISDFAETIDAVFLSNTNMGMVNTVAVAGVENVKIRRIKESGIHLADKEYGDDECTQITSMDSGYGLYTYLIDCTVAGLEKHFAEYVFLSYSGSGLAECKSVYGVKYPAVNSCTSFREAVDCILAAEAYKLPPEQDEPSEDPEIQDDPVEPITPHDPEFADYVDLKANNDGTFSWTAKGGAEIVRMYYCLSDDIPLVLDEGEKAEDHAPFLALEKGASRVAAMSDDEHLFKAMVKVCGEYQSYYCRITPLEESTSTPAVVVFSHGIGFFPRGSYISHEFIAYSHGSYDSYDAMKADANSDIIQVPCLRDGVILDRANFEGSTFTVCFFDNIAEETTIKFTKLANE